MTVYEKTTLFIHAQKIVPSTIYEEEINNSLNKTFRKDNTVFEKN